VQRLIFRYRELGTLLLPILRQLSKQICRRTTIKSRCTNQAGQQYVSEYFNLEPQIDSNLISESAGERPASTFWSGVPAIRAMRSIKLESAIRVRVLFVPDIDSWDQWDIDDTRIAEVLRTVDGWYLDGTFFHNGEIPGRDMTGFPNPFITKAWSVSRNFHPQNVRRCASFTSITPTQRSCLVRTHSIKSKKRECMSRNEANDSRCNHSEFVGYDTLPVAQAIHFCEMRYSLAWPL